MRQKIYSFIKNDGIKAILSLFIVIIALLVGRNNSLGYWEIIDISIFFVIFASFFLTIFGGIIERKLSNYFEDERKLDVNYDKLIKRYPILEYENGEKYDPLINFCYDARSVSSKRLFQKNQKKNSLFLKVRLPAVKSANLLGREIVIKDSKKYYVLPTVIEENRNMLFRAHDSSNIYNQLNVRVKDWYLDGNKFFIETERTTYYDSMLTNRAMDFKWQSGMTNRDFFQYGPFVKSLKDSKMSNHLGFNGFILSADGKIPFVKRNNSVSIGKRTYGVSVMASLKARYALNKNGNFTISGLKNSIFREIFDELEIRKEDIVSFDLNNNLLAAYRDLVEGGKPQLLFFAKVKLTKDEIDKNFQIKSKSLKKQLKKEKWNGTLKQLQDGDKLIWVDKNEMKNIIIKPDRIVFKEKVYKVMPTTSVSIALFLEKYDFLEKNGLI